MELPDSCKELFLEGFTDVYLYSAKGSTIAIPFCVANITSINDCKFSNCLLHLKVGSEDYVVCSSITAKVSTDIGGNGTVYSFEFAASLSEGYNNVRETLDTLVSGDCYIVLRTAEGQLLLCYTLPNTFLVKPSRSITQSDDTPALTFTAKAMSDLIPITV